MLFLRGDIYHYKFKLNKVEHRGTTKSRDYEQANAIYLRHKEHLQNLARVGGSLVSDSIEAEADWSNHSAGRLGNLAAQLYGGMKHRSGKKTIPCEITKADIFDMLIATRGRCEVTGIPLSISREGVERVSPWMPSIDRINSRKGYTKSNCRVVCYLANLAMSQYGEDALELMLYHYGKKKWGGKPKMARTTMTRNQNPTPSISTPCDDSS
jgi:hypothetical protein